MVSFLPPLQAILLHEHLNLFYRMSDMLLACRLSLTCSPELVCAALRQAKECRTFVVFTESLSKRKGGS